MFTRDVAYMQTPEPSRAASVDAACCISCWQLCHSHVLRQTPPAFNSEPGELLQPSCKISELMFSIKVDSEVRLNRRCVNLHKFSAAHISWAARKKMCSARWRRWGRPHRNGSSCERRWRLDVMLWEDIITHAEQSSFSFRDELCRRSTVSGSFINFLYCEMSFFILVAPFVKVETTDVRDVGTQYSAKGSLTAGFRVTRSLLCEVCVFHLWFLQFCLSVLLMRGCRSGNSSVPSSHYLRVAGSAGSCLLTRAGVSLWKVKVIMSDVKFSVSYFMQRCVQPQSFSGTYSGKGNVLISVVGMFRITKSICPTKLSF